MVVCVSEGAVTKDELMAYFKALEEAGAAHYRKLLDASRAECGLSADEIAELGAYAKSLKWSGTPGSDGHLHRLDGKRRLPQEASAPCCDRAGVSGHSRPSTRRAAGSTRAPLGRAS